jgi:hypothetical protein
MKKAYCYVPDLALPTASGLYSKDRIPAGPEVGMKGQFCRAENKSESARNRTAESDFLRNTRPWKNGNLNQLNYVLESFAHQIKLKQGLFQLKQGLFQLHVLFPDSLK